MCCHRSVCLHATVYEAAIWPETYAERQCLYATFKRHGPTRHEAHCLHCNRFHDATMAQAHLDPLCRRNMTGGVKEIPAEVSALWQRAIKANCRAAKTALFYKWLEAGADWARILGCTIVLAWLRSAWCCPIQT